MRRLCQDCKEPYAPSAKELRQVGIDILDFSGVLYRAKGCDNCGNKGYRGRMGIYELMIVDEEIRRAVAVGKDAAAIMTICVDKGMRTLRNDGILKVKRGFTSLDEILRITDEGG